MYTKHKMLSIFPSWIPLRSHHSEVRQQPKALTKLEWQATFISFTWFTRASQVALVVKKPRANAGHIRHMGSIPGSGRSPGGGHADPFQYSCLENPLQSRAWRLQSMTLQRVGHDWVTNIFTWFTGKLRPKSTAFVQTGSPPHTQYLLCVWGPWD